MKLFRTINALGFYAYMLAGVACVFGAGFVTNWNHYLGFFVAWLSLTFATFAFSAEDIP